MNSVLPARRRIGRRRDHERGAERTDRRRSTQHAETRRPDVEHVSGEHRKQRDRAAEQHGEQVERDRAEQDGRLAHESDAAEDAREIG